MGTMSQLLCASPFLVNSVTPCNPSSADLCVLFLVRIASAVCCQASADNSTATPMRRPSSFLPWQQDGSCTTHAMTAGLDLNKMGHLQVWPKAPHLSSSSPHKSS
jgi:hypothetical protein